MPIELLSDPRFIFWAVLFVAFAQVAARLLLRKQSSWDCWRTLEVLALFLGSISFIGVIVQSNQVIQSDRAEALSQKVSLLGWQLKTVGGLEYYCVPAVRSQLSPSNFDQIEKERQSVCDWSRAFQRYLSSLNLDNAPIIDLSVVGNLPTLTEQILIGDLRRIENALADYSRWRSEVIEARQSARSPGFALALANSAPLLLALAFSITLFRVLFKPSEKSIPS
jgi:hypothetical protein